MTEQEVSHGRGGAGNINPDTTQYVDGGIVRQGVEGTHGDGAFSTGRGGQFNISTPENRTPDRGNTPHPPTSAAAAAQLISPQSRITGGGNIGDVGTTTAPARLDKDFVPDAAYRPSTEVDHHTGRGGAANVQLVSDGEGHGTKTPPKGKVTDGSLSTSPENTHHISLADKLKYKIFKKKEAAH